MLARRLKAVVVVASVGMVLPAATAESGRNHTEQRVVGFQTTRSFQLRAGRAVRTFMLHERSGAILLNRVTAPRGALVIIDEQIPHVAGARVTTRTSRNAPSSSCRQTNDGLVACTQSEEWCPMPQATWHIQLVKQAGRAGPVRVDFVVNAPPSS